MTQFSVNQHRLRGTFAAFVFLTLLSGCGENELATVSGKVAFQEEPISVGTITFVCQNGKVVSGNIEDGKYTVGGLEVGSNANIAITTHEPSPMMRPPTGPEEGVPELPPLKYVEIPERYGDPKQSGLTYQIAEGTQTHDLVLQP